jgi:uncharacterized protein YjiS (DUF1127 family)
MTIRQTITRFAKAQRTTRELNKLSNRQLADIGVVREDIAAFVRARVN